MQCGLCLLFNTNNWIECPKDGNDEYSSVDSPSMDPSVQRQTVPTYRTDETTRFNTNRKHTISVELLGRETGSYQDTTARASLIPLVSSAKKAFFD